MVKARTPRVLAYRRGTEATLLVPLSLLVLLLQVSVMPVRADELELVDGVVVKFGPDGEIVILDGLVVQGQVTLTSLQDDARGGPAKSVSASPQPGDWRGLRIERSSPAGVTQLGGLQIYYAGRVGPACTLRSTEFPIGGFLVSRSAGVGLDATKGTTTTLRDLLLMENQTGFQAETGASVALQSSVISGNTVFGAVNLDPAAPVPASGIWWGHPSGPLDAGDDTATGGLFNPAGLGNAVSDGILYQPISLLIPLFGLAADPVGGALVGQPAVTFRLRGPTAVGVRLSEDPTFAGVPFEPISPTRAFTLTTADGPKTVFAEFQAATGNTAVLSLPMRLDAMGPVLAVTNVAAGAVLTRPLEVIASATDPSGVPRVEFYVDDVLVFTDTTNTFSFDWDIRLFSNGPHTLSVVGVDGVGRQSRSNLSVAIAAAPPAAPVITSPTNGSLASTPSIAVSGTAEPGVTVSLYINAALAGRILSGSSGAWTLPSVTLAEGLNTLSATASDRVGASASSPSVSVTRDTGPPSPPVLLAPRDVPGSAGVKRLDWLPPIDEPTATYNLYRAAFVFTTKGQATRIQTGITTSFANDAPPGQGTFSYAVTTLDPVGNESAISNVQSTSVDSVSPTAAVTATPSGVVGPGPVTLNVLVSESIVGDPFLSVTPQGGSPVIVPLAATGAPLEWTGTFDVLPSMASGPAVLAFSARDPAGNRGTLTTSGGTLVLDTRGPVGTVAVTPMRPLGPGTYPAILTLDETSTGTPTLRFLPPTGPSVSLLLTGGGTHWQADLVITPPMGSGPGRFELEATDGFGNTTSGIVAGAAIDIDNTPPPDPGAPSATALAGGQIRLGWGAVAGAASYRVYRAPGGSPVSQGQPAVATGLTSPTYTDLPPADGPFAYAVSALDDVGNESGLSPEAAAVSDRTPPGDPVGLVLAIEGKGIRATWTPDAGQPADTFALFRSTGPITTLLGLTPVKTGLTTPTVLDLPPGDGSYHYAVAARDLLGNQSGFAAAGPITFDQAAPVISVTGVSADQVSRTDLTIAFSATDFSLQTLSATLDGAPFVSGSTVSSEASHTLVVTAADASANTSEKTIPFAIDRTAPQVVTGGVTEGGSYDGPVTPTVTISDPRLGATSIQLNGAPFISGSTVSADGAYTLAIHAADLAGNVTDVSVHFTVDAAPPAVVSLSVDLPEAGFPALSWPGLPNADVVGYLVSRDGAKLTSSPITAHAFTDVTFDPFSTHVYSVSAVDAAGHEGPPRSATLVRAGLSLSDYGTGQVLTQRFFDSVSVQIDNPGGTGLGPATLSMILKDGSTVLGTKTRTTTPLPAGGSIRVAETFATGAVATTTRTLDLALTLPSESGSTVRMLKSFTLNAREPANPVQIFNDPIVLGGTARVSVKILNQGSARMNVKTSQAGGPTPDVEVLLKDLDGNLLSTGLLEQRGAGVITTAELAFADIGAGGSFLTRAVLVQVPSSAPAQVVLEAVVHATHSDILGGAADLPGPELRGSARAATGNPAYLASATTDKSVYDQGEIVEITGRAFDSVTSGPVAGQLVKIGVSTRGFDRFLFVTSDAGGSFATTFTPLPSEAGAYSVWATHPSVTERASQAAFDILGLSINPPAFNLRMSRNSSFPINVELKNTGEAVLGGFSFSVTGGNGVSGTVDSAALPPVLGAGQKAKIVLNVSATIDADLANFATLQVLTGEGVTRTFDVSIALVPALPTIQTEPSFVEAGVGTGAIFTRSVRIRNLGFAPLEDIMLEAPATPWIALGVGPSLPPIPVGGFLDVPVIFNPPADLTPAIVMDKFVIRSGNHVPYTETLVAIVTSSTTGDATFEIRNTENVLLPGASVWIQNLQVPTLTFTRSTGANGQTTFESLPTGPYQFRVQATGVEPGVGKFDVQAGQVTAVPLILNVVYVSFEWSVTPVVIEDRYDFKLTATFETHVPAPVLVADPANFDITIEPGATFVGEYTLTNHGLVAGDNLRITTSSSSGLVFETLVTELPRIAAMQTIRVPFRLTRLGGTGTQSPAGALAPLAGSASVAAQGSSGGGSVAPAADGIDPCQPQAAYSYNAVTYTCVAGVVTSSSATVNVAARGPLNLFGICDEGCNPCACLPGVAGSICKCLKGLAGGEGPTCDCLGAVLGDTVGGACSCLLEGDPMSCLGLIPGPIGEAVGLINNIGSCLVAIVKCTCQYLPSVCTPGGGTVGGGGGIGGGGGGGGGCCWGGVSSNAGGCN